jgi:hypothetical protein
VPDNYSSTAKTVSIAPPSTRFPVAISLAVFLLAQTAFLAWHQAIPSHLSTEAWLLTGVLAIVLATAWQIRSTLPSHADMLLLMLAWGGFGMLFGWYLDGGMNAHHPDSGSAELHANAHVPNQQQPPVSEASPEHQHPAQQEHTGHEQGHAGHEQGHGHGAVYSGWFRWINGMNVLMLAFAFPPSIWWARCLQAYRPFPIRLAWVLGLDAAGMVLGMMAGGRLLGHPLGDLLDAPVAAHHLGMLAGMLAGMYATMLLRRWLAPLPGLASA